MSQGTSNDSVGDLRYDAERSISLVEADIENSGIEGVRSTVSITREAARAISITALETEKVLDSWVSLEPEENC